MYHTPVMLTECIEGLNIKPDGIYIDATFGGGGHSREILKQLKSGRLFAFDQDADAAENSKAFEDEFGDDKFTFVHQNFRFAKNFLRYHNESKADGILADLGVSSHQFDVAERGFSFRLEGELDMRMNREANFSAKDLVNTYSHQKLSDILRKYGEIKNPGRVASAIIRHREENEIATTGQILDILSPLFKGKARGKNYNKENQQLAQVFQAIRIEVNNELQVLKELIEIASDILKPNGRLVVITYHSLEDRLVKNYIKHGIFDGEAQKDIYGNTDVPFKAINRKVIIPSAKEIEQNNRARSAKLRIAERF